MAKEFQSMPTIDIQKITDCSLYRDSGLLFNSHHFCVDCSEKLVEGVPCPLCRPFLAVPDDKHDGVPRNYLVDKLEDLHSHFVEKTLNITSEKRFDTPLVEQFGIKTRAGQYAQVAWLENKIYVLESGLKRIRIFADRTPFNELPEGIEMEGLCNATGFIACTANRSLSISDADNLCIWNIQMPNKELIRWDIEPGSPSSLSITPDMELLAVVYEYNKDENVRDDEVDNADDDGDEDDHDDDDNNNDDVEGDDGDEDDHDYDDDDNNDDVEGDDVEDDDQQDDDDVEEESEESNAEEDNEEHACTRITMLQVYRLTDGSLTRSMRLPKEVKCISYAAELPNKTFVISYSKICFSGRYEIGILSTDGESLSFIRTLDFGFFDSIKIEPYNFVVTDNGEIFFVDYCSVGRVIWFNSKLTDYRIISNNDCQLVDPSDIVYIKEKQQLMVCSDEVEALPGPVSESLVSVFHLSPCSLAKEGCVAVIGEN